MRKHLLFACKKITPEVKAEIETHIRKQAINLEKPTSASRKVLKREAGQTPLSQHFDLKGITPNEQKQLDTKLVRMLVMNGVSFSVVQSPWFLDFLQALRPTYIPAGQYACYDLLPLPGSNPF